VKTTLGGRDVIPEVGDVKTKVTGGPKEKQGVVGGLTTPARLDITKGPHSTGEKKMAGGKLCPTHIPWDKRIKESQNSKGSKNSEKVNTIKKKIRDTAEAAGAGGWVGFSSCGRTK